MTSVLVTGAGGYLGRQFVPALVEAGITSVVALDVRELPEAERVPGVIYQVGDVRDAEVVDVLREHAIDSVVHLAAIVTPPKGSTRELEHSIDVLGTRNVLQACIDAGVRQLVVSSSGAAYGYHADNPVPSWKPTRCAAIPSSRTPTTNARSRRCSRRRAPSTPSCDS